MGIIHGNYPSMGMWSNIHVGFSAIPVNVNPYTVPCGNATEPTHTPQWECDLTHSGNACEPVLSSVGMRSNPQSECM